MELSLSSRLIIAAGATLSLSGAALLYTAVENQASELRAAFADQLGDGLDTLRIELAEQAIIGDYATIQQILDKRARRKGIAMAGWTDNAGKSLVARNTPPAAEAPGWFIRWIALPTLQGRLAVEVGGVPYGTVFERLTPIPGQNQIWGMFKRQALVLAAGMLAFFAVAVAVLRWGLRPLHVLAEGAARFGRGDYSVRLALRGPPEMRPGIEAFNLMAARIEALLDSLRQREAVLEENESKLRDITSNLGEGVYLLDRDWRVSFMNPEAERLLGWRAEELLGKDAHEAFHEHGRGGSRVASRDCPIRRTNFAGKTYRSRDEVFRRRDGTGFPVALVAAPIRKEGRVAGSVVAFYDITERKRTEESLHKFFLAVEHSANSVVITDAGGNIEYVNPQFTKTTGWRAEEVIGRNPRILKSWEAPAGDYEKLWQTLAAGGEWRGEFRNCRKDGSLYWESASISPIRNRRGKITHFIAVTEDITARKQAEEDLKRLNETLEQRVREEVESNREKDHLLLQQSRFAAMGEMIGNIAHQWRQPLNALGLLLENIHDAYRYRELDDRYLEESMDRGRRLIAKMSSTIDDFRNFFKPNREKTAFSVAATVNDVLYLVEAAFGNRGIGLQFTVEEDGRVEGFPNEYSQVVLNLLANAKDAILERGVTGGRVEIRAWREGRNMRLAVRDNGGGVADEVAGKIFDPYFTTREKGTGIGLYMSKMIIENNMGGTIEFHNTGEGAEFVIVTPMSETHDSTGGENA
jgi:PAS domain S-box-containing protein